MTQTAPAPAEQGTPPTVVDAVVIGAGFSGMYMLHRLRGLGCTVRVFEAGTGVGGTWFWNRYPGARCDVTSMEYSFSFDPQLEQEWKWTEKYPTQPEILRYANHVADRYDLRRDMQFETRVTETVWDEEDKRWMVRTDRGDQVSAQFVVHASGCLSVSKQPEIPGVESFRGRYYHTSSWPHEGVDFTGQRVGVIGTGSSAIQSIPLIAAQAADLTVFQRTPNFAIPAHNHSFPPGYQEERKAHYPEHRQHARESLFGIPVPMPEHSALEVDPDERTKVFQRAWENPDNTLIDLMLAYTDIIVDKGANETAAEFIRERIRETVTDPEVAEELCPTDYPIGTKRICVATDYYATYNRDNVHLVNVRKTPLVEITAEGVRTSERDYEFDSLVLATGFDAQTGALMSIDIRGRDGVVLAEKWAAGPRSYLGIGVAGFPNMFIITGPQSPSVLSNMMVSIEQHVEWIADCIKHVRDHSIQTIEPTIEAEDGWVQHNEEVGNMTLFPTADSWYMGSNVKGKPRVFMPYIGGVGVYRQTCDEVAAEDYRGFTLAS